MDRTTLPIPSRFGAITEPPYQFQGHGPGAILADSIGTHFSNGDAMATIPASTFPFLAFLSTVSV